MFFIFLFDYLLRWEPAQIIDAVQTPRGHFLFILDYLEDPEETEDSAVTE